MKNLLCTTVLILVASGLNALEMDSSRSTLNITSVKNDRLAELFAFERVSGTIDDASGKASIEVALDSIDSGIEIRDERMRKYLFNTEAFKTASFTADIDLKALKSLKPGEQREIELKGELAMSGHTVPISFQTQVTRLNSGALSVATVAPGFIDVTRHKMAPGIEKLRSLAGLDNISLAVPVTFSVVFK
ncbi:MAG: polyisoprenoid-binding protein YceI [Porticoccus sp.]|jgi:polyisoprenoid-binding protein YceI|uniref:YceI family protein n=1 Tax=Porticoccus sp. TaxID=2024853 RepID=UPI0039E36820|tara:strand:- start:419 stop:988 length:570 start_codon:yes stop_codon:yes gene_type:complete